MIRTDNLTPWKKGQSGNPNGAPPMWETSAELYKRFSLMNKEQLEKELAREDLPAKHVMVINDIIRAIAGRDRSIDRFQDRTDGKPMQYTDITTKGQSIGSLSAETLDVLDKMYEKNTEPDQG